MMNEILDTLLKDIDYKATADNVDDFFRKRVPMLQRLSNDNDLLHIPSQNLDGMPAFHDNRNRAGDRIDRVLEADHICREVADTIRRCSKVTQDILINRYVRNKLDRHVADVIGYQDTQYTKYKRRALNEFADRFELSLCWQDLHIYKKV